ncbi:extracellular conserved serine-rich protein [Talaromyces stipitatus ATCC 10500]|uniref:Extracellular conserved serine-rich protein n=1 Tax=Talaromyces stipitatus (strain ATCC 10500 / CBS 375.48 / QM 6759 / NRRL 1006) TaxID=441959 RepID=B8LY70_TALSN|nr:extracellular conserved serine-rich protein [Talaromyces stipitatus ATCC 10500]EED23316.1 extracellular conserved serine-rich protein [Talaromyces stipitatus ATCC 10500]
MQIKLGTALMLATSASALQVTSPSRGDKWDLTHSNEVTWDSVESDPTSFDIQLVNEHVNPPVVKTIATNVQTSAGSYSFSNVAVDIGDDYQINLVSTEAHNTGILAQSAQFDVSNAASNNSSSSTSTASSTSTTSSSSSSSSTTASTATTTSSSSASSSEIRTSSIPVSVLGCIMGSVLALLM